MDTRGIDHLALVCDDMPTAMDFYTRVMGFRLVHVRRVPYEQDRWQPPYDNLRHYFFDMGNDSLFAIFEYPKGLPRQNRDHVGGMQHVAFHVAPEHFDRLVEHVRGCGIEVRGAARRALLVGVLPRPLRHAPRAATDRSGVKQSVVESVRQTEEEARAELETLFSDPAEVERWLARMPLKKEPAKEEIRV